MIDAVIDISHHNGVGLDFNAAARAGIIGVIHKATQGLSLVDPMYQTNKAAIAASALKFGSYHFGDGSDGGAQARAFLAVAAPAAHELVALDLERNPVGSSMTLEQARAFVTAVFGAIGKWPLLYASYDLKELLGGKADPVLSQCPLWLAQYGPTTVLPPGWSNWALWQYTDGAIGRPAPVPGIGHCDRDRFAGDAAGLTTFWGSVSR